MSAPIQNNPSNTAAASATASPVLNLYVPITKWGTRSIYPPGYWTVQGILAKVSNEEWKKGIYILFEKSVAKVTVDSVQELLHGEEAGDSLGTIRAFKHEEKNALACVWMLKTEPPESHATKESTAAKDHVLIKVAIDGRFVIGENKPSPHNDSKDSNDSKS